MFTRARHLSLSSAKSTQSTIPLPHHIYLRPILILSSHLRPGIASRFPSHFPHQNLVGPRAGLDVLEDMPHTMYQQFIHKSVIINF